MRVMMNTFSAWAARSFVLAAGLLLPIAGLAADTPSASPARPNIVLIVLDDVGYGDLGAYGSEIATPAFDSLAQSGITFSNFHATPSCSPSRAALLTGREAHRVGMGLVTEYDFGPGAPAFRGRITPAAATLAEVLQQQDYGTYAIGKWHLVPPSHQNAAGPFEHWPLGKGFDRFYGFLAGSTDQFRPGLVRDNTIIDVSYEEGEVLTTDLVNNAVTYLTDHVSQAEDRPFLMYLSLPGMHAPHQAADEFLDRYRGKYAAGWDEIRAARFQRQQASGLVPAGSTLAPANPGVESWADLSATQKKVYARFQEVYAGFMEQTDHEVGRFLAALEQLGQLDNTLIVLLSDNGGSRSGNFDGSVNSSAWNNGVRETVEDNLAVLDRIGRPGSGPNYPRGWAQASNTPFPLYKTDTYGGGVNVPLVISWPAKLQARGEIRHQYHHITDIMPSLFEILDIAQPEVVNGIPQLPVDGISMAYTFDGGASESRRSKQFYRMGDHRGIYSEGWTAAARHKRGTPLNSDHWSLYDLRKDFTQSDDVSASHPEKMDELKSLWQAEAERLGAAMMLEPLLAKNKKPPGSAIKNHFTFYPGSSHLPEKSTPRVMDRSFTVKIPVSAVDNTSEGVLVAHGNGHSGYVLYVQDQKLVFEYNYLSSVASVGRRYKLVSTADIPAGKSTLGFSIERTAKGKGEAELTIDGKVVAQTTMAKTLTERISHEGLDVGQDRYSAVGQDYTGPFPFTGHIDKVEYRIFD